MSLNNLQLSPAVLSALYPSTLISLDDAGVTQTQSKTIEEKEPETLITETSWKYLGSNKQNILAVVNYDQAVHLPDEELNFLTNMLTACKLGLGDVAIVNLNNYKQTGYKAFLSEFKSKVVFLFGVEPLDFGLPASFPYFQIQAIANCTFLYTPSLQEQRNDTLLKSKLWVSLRTIFGI